MQRDHRHSELERPLSVFRENQDEFASKHHGQFVVIHDDGIMGFFDDELEASPRSQDPLRARSVSASSMLAAGGGRRACLSFQSSLTLIKKYVGTVAFTVKYPGRVNLLVSEAGISEAFDPKRSVPGSKQPPFHTVRAIWDTGASRTCITEDVVAKLGLKAIDKTTNHTAAGLREAGVYLVNVQLPNTVVFPVLRVTSEHSRVSGPARDRRRHFGGGYPSRDGRDWQWRLCGHDLERQNMDDV